MPLLKPTVYDVSKSQPQQQTTHIYHVYAKYKTLRSFLQKPVGNISNQYTNRAFSSDCYSLHPSSKFSSLKPLAVSRLHKYTDGNNIFKTQRSCKHVVTQPSLKRKNPLRYSRYLVHKSYDCTTKQ